ncbi:hypothetical protein IE53DRAFT_384597 [Violaceomyces palustris]|uniref:Uncharacterized protein n=1 Tax=Violaceomyces palustris TaxID=1673888 RepID=A0ACD0P4J8_9BASI|nr:hypothetical protein IE53DRAFT_384597 [Violaceomyces palustris]
MTQTVYVSLISILPSSQLSFPFPSPPRVNKITKIQEGILGEQWEKTTPLSIWVTLMIQFFDPSTSRARQALVLGPEMCT